MKNLILYQLIFIILNYIAYNATTGIYVYLYLWLPIHTVHRPTTALVNKYSNLLFRFANFQHNSRKQQYSSGCMLYATTSGKYENDRDDHGGNGNLFYENGYDDPVLSLAIHKFYVFLSINIQQ